MFLELALTGLEMEWGRVFPVLTGDSQPQQIVVKRDSCHSPLDRLVTRFLVSLAAGRGSLM